MAVARIVGGIDPLVRLLALAIVLASVLPVTAEYRPIAQAVSNSAIFLLFLLNGLRLPRAEVLNGLGHMRFLLPLTLWCFAAMGLAGWGLAKAGDALLLPPQVALGMLFLGVLPSTAGPGASLRGWWRRSGRSRRARGSASSAGDRP